MTTNMFYKLLAVQIVPFWDAIKYAVATVDEVDKKNLPNYFNELLQALLSDKAQCFVILTEDRILQGLTITRIVVNKVEDVKEMYIQTAYSMVTMSDAELMEYFTIIKQFAEKEGCKRITYNSRNPRIWQIAKVVNCAEQYRHFSFELKGD